MVVVKGIDSLKSMSIRRRFGQPSGYGQAVFGVSNYGLFIDQGGIYQMRKRLKGPLIVKSKFYWPTNPNSIPQQASRLKFSSAVLAWQSLTISQKNVYRELAKPQKIKGYNYFIRDYFATH